MKRSTTLRNSQKIGVRLLAILFWLIVWQIASACVGQEILLVSPVLTCKTFFQLLGTTKFYQAVLGPLAGFSPVLPWGPGWGFC